MSGSLAKIAGNRKNVLANPRRMKERPRAARSDQNDRRGCRMIHPFDFLQIHSRAIQPCQYPVPEVVPSHRAPHPNWNPQFGKSIRGICTVAAEMFFDRIDPNRKAVLDLLNGTNQDILHQIPRNNDFAADAHVHPFLQMINWNLSPIHKPRVCAVSYLNTVPLVWGIEHGAERDIFEMSYALPAECADRLASGEAEIGIVPVIEMARQKLAYFRGTGIACRGAVRSILLVSKVPFHQIKTLATDTGSRTSVMLSRIILAEKYGVAPKLISRRAELARMLGEADAALVIGDPALHLDPAKLPFETLDLGLEWTQMTGLPMVFAVWSGHKDVMQPRFEQAFIDSCRAGLANMDQIVREQAPIRGITEQLARDYLTTHIVFELNERDHEGMNLYLKQAVALDRAAVGVLL